MAAHFLPVRAGETDDELGAEAVEEGAGAGGEAFGVDGAGLRIGPSAAAG